MSRKIRRSICEIWLYENYGSQEYVHVLESVDTLYKSQYFEVSKKLFKEGLEVAEVKELTNYSTSYIKQIRREIKIATHTYLRTVDFIVDKDSLK